MENISSSEYILPDVPFIKLEPNDEAVSASNKFQSCQKLKKSNEARTAGSKKINFMCGACGKMYKVYADFKMHPCIRRNSKISRPGLQDPLNFHPFEKPLIKEEPADPFASIIIKVEPDRANSNMIQKIENCEPLVCAVKKGTAMNEPQKKEFLAIVYDETEVIDIAAQPSVNKIRRSRKSLGIIRKEEPVFQKERKTPALCSECGLDFESVSNLKKHFAKAHKTKLSTVKDKNEFVGDLLGPSSDLKALDDHASNDDSDSEFFGDFPSKVELKRGSRRKNLGAIRDEEPEFEQDPIQSLCNECGKTFSCQGYLRKHVRQVHEKLSLPQHICDVCGKVCYGSAKFNAHVSTHTAVAESCKICGKLTKYLKIHIYHHRFPGKYKKIVTCHICGIEMNKINLSNHIENVHEKKPSGVFPCELCTEIFYRFEELRT